MSWIILSGACNYTRIFYALYSIYSYTLRNTLNSLVFFRWFESGACNYTRTFYTLYSIYSYTLRNTLNILVFYRWIEKRNILWTCYSALTLKDWRLLGSCQILNFYTQDGNLREFKAFFLFFTKFVFC